jgi:type IV fimbrial biogenesis protein FimT
MDDLIFKHFKPFSLADGFTLIELLIAISILTLLLVFTLPSFRTQLLNNRITAKTNELTNSLQYARSTALSRNRLTTVCPFGSAGSTGCGVSWQNGFIVTSQPPTGGPILLQSNAAGTNDPTLTSTVNQITFDTLGLATTQANFTVCDNRGGSFAKSVTVLPTGFVQAGTTVGEAVWDDSGLICP